MCSAYINIGLRNMAFLDDREAPRRAVREGALAPGAEPDGREQARFRVRQGVALGLVDVEETVALNFSISSFRMVSISAWKTCSLSAILAS